jgi:hypothetical protein
MTLLVRTVVASTEDELRALVERESGKGWEPVGNPSHLLVGGKPAEGRAAWMWAMEKRS